MKSPRIRNTRILSRVSRPPLSAGALAETRRSPGFTMLEVLVVIGIIALLLAIAVPAANHALDSQKRNNTLSYMHVLENAIASYQRLSPLPRTSPGSPAKDRTTYFGKLPPDFFVFWASGNVTPPQEDFLAASDTNKNNIWDPGEKIESDQPKGADGYLRFNPLHPERDFPNIGQFGGVQRRMNNAWVWDDPKPGPLPVTEDCRSTESLYLYLTRLCPECKQLLANLPQKIKTNEDQCTGGPCPDKVVFGVIPGSFPTKVDEVNGEHVDLTELRDAWGKPMRYQVQRIGAGETVKWAWELRSAGPDGEFAKDPTTDAPAMFLPEAQSGDDVILSGE